jgi:hypothetical protein
MYRELAERAETTRMEVKLQRGKKRTVYERSWDPVMPVDGGGKREGMPSWMRTMMARKMTSAVISRATRSC